MIGLFLVHIVVHIFLETSYGDFDTLTLTFLPSLAADACLLANNVDDSTIHSFMLIVHLSLI